MPDDLPSVLSLAARVRADGDMLAHLGMRVHEPAIESGGVGAEALLHLEVTGVLVNALGFCHGGVVYALADTACAYALGAQGFAPATIDASVSYLLPGRRGDHLRANCEVLRRGKKFGTVEVRIHNQTDALIAVYRGTCSNVGAQPA